MNESGLIGRALRASILEQIRPRVLSDKPIAALQLFEFDNPKYYPSLFCINEKWGYQLVTFQVRSMRIPQSSINFDRSIEMEEQLPDRSYKALKRMKAVLVGELYVIGVGSITEEAVISDGWKREWYPVKPEYHPG